MTERQLYIDGGGPRLFGFVHKPDAPREALLVCPPLLEEKKSSYRALVELCRALAGDGVAGLRFDYRGSGDSDAVPARSLGELADDAARAAGLLAKEAPGLPLSLLGLRLGGTVAAILAARGGIKIRRLILINPLAEGRLCIDEILRKMKIRQAFTAGKSAATREALIGESAGETLDLDGIEVPRSFLADVEKLDLKKLAAPPCEKLAIIQLAHSERPLRELDALAGAWGGTGASFIKLVAQAFWNLSDFERPEALIAEARKIMGER